MTSINNEPLNEKVQRYLPKEIKQGLMDDSLKYRAMKVLSENFENVDPGELRSLSKQLFQELLAFINVTSLGENHLLIDCERFWKREFNRVYGRSTNLICYKRKFLERWLSERLVSSKVTLDDLSSISDYIWSLDLVCRDHIPESLTTTFPQLSNLTSLKIQFFQINETTDIITMAHCLCSMRLTTLSLTDSICINDDFIRILICEIESCTTISGEGSGLHSTLVSLNLSHNKISTAGVHLIVNYIITRNNESNLTILNLGNNLIRSEAARIIVRYLEINNSMTHLDLSLNDIAEGGALIISSLVHNENLKSLNLAGNNLLSSSILALLEMMQQNVTLETIDLSSNKIEPTEVEQIHDAMKRTQNALNVILNC